ncbi:L-type lectin family protein [Enterococcus rivorum]|uniref:lectin-like domain-containing protein n=1 Tax=Enterococcus rivorum TaxID=762845 RepID=UPI003642F11E
MGAYASTSYANAIDGIPYSFAIEFDLYSNNSTVNNGHGFDVGINGQHIANVYPGMLANYETITSGSNRYRKQLHWNLQDNLKLTDGNWTKLEVRWTAATSQLSYRTSSEARNYDSGWRHMNPDTIRTELAIKQGNTKVYWGFTGSTGQYNRVEQEVIFTRIPGLVTAKSYIKMNQNGNQVAPGTTLKANSKVQVTLGGQYLSGRQNWQAVNGKVTVPNSLSVVPNTTKVNDSQIDDSHWEGNVLSRASLNDFTIENNEQTITFEAIVKDDMTGESSISGTLEGRNAIVDADAFTFRTSPSDLAFKIVSPEDNRVFFDDITAFPIDITFIDNSKTDIEQSILTDEGDVLQNSTISSDLVEQVYSINFLDSFNKLSYGKHMLEYRLKNISGKVVSRSFNFSKQSKPKLEVLENEENSYFVGDKIPFNFNITDKDSEKLSLYMQVDEKEAVKVADYRNDFSTTVSQMYELKTDDFSSGIYTFKWFLVDENDNQSPIITYSKKITIEGTLSFQESPRNFNEVDLKLSGSRKKTMPIKIAVVDTRIKPAPWSLSVISTTGFYNEESNKYAPEDFFSYIDNEEHLLIGKDSFTYLIKNYLSQKEEIVSVNETGETGFYITPNNGMHTGSYTGSLTWVLEMTPNE